MTGPRRAAAAAVITLLAAGCGSTVQGVVTAQHGDAALQAPNGQVLPSGGAVAGPGGANAAGGGIGAGGTTGTTGTSGTGGTTPAGSTATGSSATTGGGATTGTGPAGTVGPGITKSTIFIGASYSSQTASADSAIGAAGASPSYDFRNVMNAVIDYANNHGGFAGRKMKALYYDENLSTPQDVQDQSECDYWTHDNKVLFIADASSDVLRSCAEKAGAVSFGVGGAVAATYQKFPHYVDIYSVRLDRLGPLTANGLYRAGYFSGRLGFVTWDDPNYRYAYDHGYVPALAAHGIQVKDARFVKVPQTLDAVGEMSATMSSIVTRFRSEGIDHVIIQDGHAGVWAGTGLTLEFMDQAESQHYYPRYGQNAGNSPGWSGLPSDQMDKAVAIMDSDFLDTYDQGWRPNAQRQKCFKIEADAGFPVSQSNVNDAGLAAQACDTVFFAQKIVNSAASLTSNGVMHALEGLGRAFPSAFVYGTQFGQGLHDGSAAVRRADYFNSCKCLKYSGGPYYP